MKKSELIPIIFILLSLSFLLGFLVGFSAGKQDRIILEKNLGINIIKTEVMEDGNCVTNWYKVKIDEKVQKEASNN